MDAFVRIRKQLAQEAAAREQLCQQVESKLAPVPVTSADVTYVDQPARDAAWQVRTAKVAAACRSLVARHRANTASRAGQSRTLRSRYQLAQAREQLTSWQARSAVPSRRLTAAQRDLISWIRSSERRAALAAEIAGLVTPGASAKPTTSKPWRGLVPGQEVRVNTRGAYGKRGIKGAAANVTQRDAHSPVGLLRKMPAGIVVGVATHPDATQADVAQLIQLVREQPSRATVRVTQADGSSQVKPVSDYAQLATQRRQATQATRSQAAARLAQDVALASKMGQADPNAAQG